jgi:hypothetical protein
MSLSLLLAATLILRRRANGVVYATVLIFCLPAEGRQGGPPGDVGRRTHQEGNPSVTDNVRPEQGLRSQRGTVGYAGLARRRPGPYTPPSNGMRL